MSIITTIIVLALTVVIPLKLTHDAYKSGNNVKQWAIYWGFYSLINGLFWLLPFLSESPFNFIFIVLSVWLYHDSFKGALLLDDLFRKSVASNEAVASNINLIAEKIQFLNLFEGAKPIEKSKTQ